MRAVLLAVLALAALTGADDKVSYHGYQVVRVLAETAEHVKLLNLVGDVNSEVLMFGSPSLLHPLELGVPPKQVDAILATLRAAGMKPTVTVADIQAEIDAVMAENERNSALNKMAAMGRSYYVARQRPMQHNFYREMDEVNTAISDFTGSYPDLVTRKTLAYHTEGSGNPVYYLEIGTPGADKPVIFIEGLAHAREWIVTASLLYTIDTMLAGYQSGDPRARAALEKYTWLIIPVVNPDGYEYSWTNNRMWRKNRNPITTTCTGVDLNRNYDVDFGQVGASSSCNSDTYHGPSPFSEAETMGVAKAFRDLGARAVSFLSVHAYSQLLLHPWGYKETNNDQSPPANDAALKGLGAEMKKALESNGQTYWFGTAYSVLGYAASGAAEDWALQEKGDIFAYCYELRPSAWSSGGFDIPPSQIIPTGQEFLASLYVLAEQMNNFR